MGKRKKSKWSVDRRQLLTGTLLVSVTLGLNRLDRMFDRLWPDPKMHQVQVEDTVSLRDGLETATAPTTKIAAATDVNGFSCSQAERLCSPLLR